MSYYNLPKFKAFRFWCQKVLPLVYDDSLSYYEVLSKVVHGLNLQADVINEIEDILEGSGIDIDEAVQKVMDRLEEEGVIDDAVDEAINTLIESGDIDARVIQVVEGMITDGDFDNKINSLIGEQYEEVVEPELSKAIKEYDTFGDLPTSGLAVGSIVQTKGYRSIGDDGASMYRVHELSDNVFPYNAGYGFEILGTVFPEKAGAYGDGTHDDASVIQSCINYYKVITLKYKTYSIGSTIEVTSNSVRINGNLSVLRRAQIVNAPIIQCANRTNFEISDVIFSTETQSELSMMVSIISTIWVKIKRCKFNNSYGYCMRINSSTYVDVSDCLFTSATGGEGNPGGAIYMQGGNVISITECVGNSLSDHLVYLDGSVAINHVSISGCKCINGNSENALTNAAAIVAYGQVHNLDITNCNFNNVKTGIVLQVRNDKIPDNVTISNCSMHNLWESGIYCEGNANTISSRSNIAISNCVINTVGQDGIDFRYINNASISNCIIITGVRTGISMSYSRYCNAIGCNVENFVTGVMVGYLGECTHCSIYDCSVGNCQTDGIYIRLGTYCNGFNNHTFGTFGNNNYVNASTNGVSVNQSENRYAIRSIFWNTGIPTTGLYNTGDICLDSTGTTNGWRCTAGGGPGTWVARSST